MQDRRRLHRRTRNMGSLFGRLGLLYLQPIAYIIKKIKSSEFYLELYRSNHRHASGSVK